MKKNPFQFGNPVPPDLFIDHQRQLRMIVNRILNHGQSNAIVGEPRLGKTSLIRYISSPKNYASLFGEGNLRLIFIHIDAQRLDQEITPCEFWRIVIESLSKQLLDSKIRLALSPAIKACIKYNFNNQKLGDFFTMLYKHNHLAVLIIDEFDSLFSCHSLVNSSFFGGLRSMASLGEGMLMIIASRLDLGALTQRTKEANTAGSPFTNIFAEVPMACFTRKDSLALLEKGREYFTPEDMDFIYRISGGHPYFLQVAAYYLWDAYQDKSIPKDSCWKYTCEQLYPYVANTMRDTWRLWSPSVRKVFSIIALDDIPQLIQKKDFDMNFLMDSLEDYETDIRFLERQGFVQRIKGESKNNLQITAEAMLWWISDEIVISMRDGNDLGKWLADQQWEGPLKKSEKAQLLRISNTLTGWLKGGIDIFVKSAAEGLGKGLSAK